MRSASAAGSATGAGGRNVAGSTGAVVVVGGTVVVGVAAVVSGVRSAACSPLRCRASDRSPPPPPQAATARPSASARLVAMGLRQRILRFLHAESPVDADPDALVEAADVPLVQGPLLLSRLESEGIEATGIESFDIVTNVRSRMRIMVRHADLAAARDIIERA